jgi:hypothetical protein
VVVTESYYRAHYRKAALFDKGEGV